MRQLCSRSALRSAATLQCGVTQRCHTTPQTSNLPFPSSAYYPPAARTALAAQEATLPSNFRNWHQNENWCTLCQEPFGQWNEHRGKRDHLCLEMFFDAVVDYQRTWGPDAVWSQFRSRFERASFAAIFGHHERGQAERRRELTLLLSFLTDEGVIFPGPTKWREPALQKIGIAAQGAIAMFKWLHPPILAVFPRADAKQVSSFSQMCATPYNMETVFDMCSMKDLLGPGDLPTTTRGDEQELDCYTKGSVVRNILGQLRWAMERDEQHPSPHNIVATSVPPHLTLLGEHAAQSIIAELLFCRICEYVSRVEAVWREMGHVAMSDKVFLEGPPPPYERTAHTTVQNCFHRGIDGMLEHNAGKQSHTYGAFAQAMGMKPFEPPVR